MKINARNIGIFIFCLLLGICMTVQTKTTNSDHAFVSAKVLSDNEVSMAAEKEEIERLKGLIEETEKTLALYKSEYVSASEIANQVEANYEDAKLTAGFTAVKGAGISIFLDDGVRDLYEWENANDIIVHDLDIMIIINELIKAGAEAISINGERYTPTTEISCSGHTVKINGRTHARPFYIYAVGDQSTLHSAMTVPGGYGDLLLEYGLIFNVEKSDSVIIPAYKGSLNMNYMILEEEGE